MRRAIADAAVGDEQKREDPSVDELQRRVAELLGQEASLFVPTATMANQIALKLHSRPGDVLLAEETSHVLVYEYGGAAAHAGLMSLGLTGANGRVTPEQIRAAAAPSTKIADQRASVLSLENTHNNAGGRVWPLDELAAVAATARELGLALHLDGARLLNAATALGVEPATFTSRFDTVTLCLSKGLGCPLGALLAGSNELIERAWREKHLFGGAMRQAGIVAAAGDLRARPPPRTARRRPRSCATARGVAGGSGHRDRPRAGRDQLRADRPRPARARPGFRSRRLARSGRRPLGDDPSDRRPGRHPSRDHGRGHRSRRRADSESSGGRRSRRRAASGRRGPGSRAGSPGTRAAASYPSVR